MVPRGIAAKAPGRNGREHVDLMIARGPTIYESCFCKASARAYRGRGRGRRDLCRAHDHRGSPKEVNVRGRERVPLEKSEFGLTPEERERLAGQPVGQADVDFRAGAIAFTSLLVVCALIVAVSLMTRPQTDMPGPLPSRANAAEPVTRGLQGR